MARRPNNGGAPIPIEWIESPEAIFNKAAVRRRHRRLVRRSSSISLPSGPYWHSQGVDTHPQKQYSENDPGYGIYCG